jgi:hypothetical protein
MNNKVVIMSGVSGSGKSTYAERLLNETQGVKVSADHFFTWSDGSYHFDASQLIRAHGDCFRRFIGFCQTHVSCIVVDNTNINVEHISPYVLGGQAYLYQVEVITLMPQYNDLPAFQARNVHGVPLDTIQRQYHALKNRRLPSWWKETFMAVYPSVRE